MNNAAKILSGIDLVSDPDTLNGKVTRESLPVETARKLCASLEAAGYEASVAVDNDDRSAAWLYVVEVTA